MAICHSSPSKKVQCVKPPDRRRPPQVSLEVRKMGMQHKIEQQPVGQEQNQVAPLKPHGGGGAVENQSHEGQLRVKEKEAEHHSW